MLGSNPSPTIWPFCIRGCLTASSRSDDDQEIEEALLFLVKNMTSGKERASVSDGWAARQSVVLTAADVHGPCHCSFQARIAPRPAPSWRIMKWTTPAAALCVRTMCDRIMKMLHQRRWRENSLFFNQLSGYTNVEVPKG